MRLRMVQNIQPNDSATKRTHNTTVPAGHTVHPSKVPKPNPQANLSSSSIAAPTQSTFTGMSAQGAYVHTASSYVTEPPMDMSNSFAPIERGIMGYNVMRDDNSSSDNASRKNSRWNSRLQVRNNGKGKFKPSKKGKRDPSDPFWQIPEFGKASGDARVVLFTLTQFSESTNPLRKRLPTPIEHSNLPGYVVQSPDRTFVSARKRPDQATDQELCKVYHNALEALYQLGDSSRLYYLHDEMKQSRTLRGQPIQYLNGQAAGTGTCTRKPETVSGRLLEGA
jgi:hypothetical protein